MAEAKMHNGRAIVAYNAQGQAVNSDGEVIEGAPKRPKDTDPAKQPGAGYGAMSPEERQAKILADALATALGRKPAAAPAAAAPESDEDEGVDSEDSDDLPKLDEMPGYLATMTDVDELKALKRQDTRKGGKELIQARIDALKAAE